MSLKYYGVRYYMTLLHVGEIPPAASNYDGLLKAGMLASIPLCRLYEMTTEYVVYCPLRLILQWTIWLVVRVYKAFMRPGHPELHLRRPLSADEDPCTSTP